MEQNGVTGQSTALTRQSLLPVRVSDGAFFHVRYRGKTGEASQNAFIAHTFASVRALLAAANCPTPDVYLCSKTVGRDMAVRRVTTVSELPYTDMCILNFEDGRGVLWDENMHLGAISAYVEIDAPLNVGQLVNVPSRAASPSNDECEPNDAGQDGG